MEAKCCQIIGRKLSHVFLKGCGSKSPDAGNSPDQLMFSGSWTVSLASDSSVSLLYPRQRYDVAAADEWRNLA